MKRTTRILAILTALVLIVGAIGIYALASDSAPNATAHKEAEAEGYFLYYDADAEGTKYTKVKNSSFKTYLNKMDNGDVIKLLSDVHFRNTVTVSNSDDTKTETAESPDVVNIDLNGYQLSIDYYLKSSAYMITPAKNTTLNVYSSCTENIANICAYAVYNNANDVNDASNGSIKNTAIFRLLYDNTNIYLGEKADAPVINIEGDISTSKWSASISKEECDGDYINTFSPMLLTTYLNHNYNPQNCTFYVNGGKHYQTILSNAEMFALYAGVDLVANNADFISGTGGAIIGFHRNSTLVVVETVNKTDDEGNVIYQTDANGDYVLDDEGNKIPETVSYYAYSEPADANVTMNNCFLYTGGTIINSLYESDADETYKVKASRVALENCTLVGSATHSISKGAPTYTNCRFSTPTTNYESNTAMARTHLQETVEIYTGVMHKNEDGTWNYFWDIEKLEDAKYTINYISATEGNYVEVTWKTPLGEKTELWHKSDDVYPSTSTAALSNEILTYTLPQIKSTADSGDKITYELTPHINFTIQANIALHTDFTFNLYIPKSVGDSKLIKSARIDKLSADNVDSIGTPFAITECDTREIEVAPDYFETYYILKQGISAAEGDAEYRLVLNIEGAFGEEVTHNLDFSIFGYADLVEKGAYSDKAKTLVGATKTYIKTARNYFYNGSTLPYPIEDNKDISAIAGVAEAVKKATASNDVKKVFKSIILSPENQLKFLFNFKDGATGKVTFTYPYNNKQISVTKDVSGLDYYEIGLRALDLRGTIKIDLESTGTGVDYTYSLANYVYYIENDAEESIKNDATLHALTDAMWAYSKAAYDYTTTATTDTPEVELSVAGNTVTSESYVIVAGEKELNAATALQKAIFAKTGQSLEIVSAKDESKNGIIVEITDPSIYYDLKTFVDGADLIINCSFASFVDSGMTSFISEHISALNKSFDFTSEFADSYYTNKFYYSDFGIYGNDMNRIASEFSSSYANVDNWHGEVLTTLKNSGILVDDFAAIKAAHEFANTTQRHTVYADKDAVYYFDTTQVSSAAQIVIQTSVNWGNAKFILDDSAVTSGGATNVFSVKSTVGNQIINDKIRLNALVDAGINPETTSIDLDLGYSAMIVIEDKSNLVFRRKGYGQWNGAAMTELLVLDKDGNLDPSTPVMFNYTNLSSITVYNLDIPELNITGGDVITVVPTIEGTEISMGRGLSIERSNTRVENLLHSVIGEFDNAWEQAGGKTSYYNGFYVVTNASDVTFYNCTLQGRRCYGHSTYEISLKMANDVTFDSCIQTNFYVDSTTHLPVTEDTKDTILAMSAGATWGAAGTNFCKNFTYINSTISRYDAHQGLYNGYIINTNIQGIEVVGWGEFVIDNTNIYKYGTGGAGNGLIHLRSDYGRTWNGTITFKDTDVYYYEDSSHKYANNTEYNSTILDCTYSNWYWGYICYFPNLVIDGMEFYSQLDSKGVDEQYHVPLTSEAVGAVQLFNHNFTNEPNIHLSTTKSTYAIYSIIDTDGDGYIDNSLSFDVDGDGYVHDKYEVVEGKGVLYSQFTSDQREQGITTELKINQNPVVPPNSITILNSFGYDFETKLKAYMGVTNFFDNTLIYIEVTDANGSFVEGKYINNTLDDSPFLPLE